MRGRQTLDEQTTAHAARRHVSDSRTVRANRSWWDANADEYQAEHGDFLGDARFVWCPEGLDETDARLLGADLRGKRVLEVGAGAAQCSRWLIAQGALAVASDLSWGQLAHSVRIDAVRAGAGSAAGVRSGDGVGNGVGTGSDTDNNAGSSAGSSTSSNADSSAGSSAEVPLVQADATRLPFASDTFDIVCAAYGAVPFVADSAAVMREAARVLKPGGRWVFSVTHPTRWSFPDDPGDGGLTVRDSYFDRRPYVEYDETGVPTYAEHHRTLGDRVREITAAGLTLVDLVEPEWPARLEQEWGGWSPLRGKLIPGTAIFVTAKPA